MSETKSKIVSTLDEIQRNIHNNLLKIKGFKKRGRTWNRFSSDKLVQVINFQTGQYPVGNYIIPGIRENLYGLFTVNIGIYIPEISELEDRKLVDFVQDYNCHIRARLGQLSHEGDLWWDLSKSSDNIYREVSQRINDFTLPFFQELENRDLILRNLVQMNEKCTLSPRANLDIALIYFRRGNKRKAKELFTKQYLETNVKGHKRYVIELSERLGIKIL